MSTLEIGTLWVHIGAGVLALLAGIVALATDKGGRRHRRAGKVFVASMGIVVATVFVLLAIDPTPNRVFLALVAVFSGYLAFSGSRVLARKRPADRAEAVDWVAAASVVLACLALAAWGVGRLATGETFGVVLVVFGAVGIGSGGNDVRAFRAPEGRATWTVAHLQRMVGAFIATVTAVSAVNLTSVVGVAAWLWPTVAGIPLIAHWSRKYEPS